MFKINRKIEYALIALKYMSHKAPGQITSAKEICDMYNTPFDPTSRVLQIMAQHGIVQAEQGAKGGDLSPLRTRLAFSGAPGRLRTPCRSAGADRGTP